MWPLRVWEGILRVGGYVFGSLGVPELLLIFVVALLLFGPRQLPNIGRTIGRAMGEFRRASNDFKQTIEEEVSASEIRDVRKDLENVVRPDREKASGPERGAAADAKGDG